MTCRETVPLLPLFVDGELDARQMRQVALHSTRCPACERQLRDMETVQDLVAGYVSQSVEELGVVEIWSLIAPRVDSVRRPWLTRVRAWWESGEAYWVRVPLYAGLAAVLALLAARWLPIGGVSEEQPRVVVDNSVILDSVRSDAPSLALLNEPQTNTMVLWVTDEGSAQETVSGEGP